ncbi:hypothetical protein BDF22DRAFT_692409 [Syncephalis plumigaleata]|nr:hypothetical protein BDF22DRAFT_692409 [Syncephalis plumigaleata]
MHSALLLFCFFCSFYRFSVRSCSHIHYRSIIMRKRICMNLCCIHANNPLIGMIGILLVLNCTILPANSVGSF